MHPKTIFSIFFSPTGTSRKIATAVAQAICGEAPDGPGTTRLDLTHASAPETTLPANAVAVFAVPVYGGHIPPTALARMDSLRGDGTPAVVIAVYGNRAFEGAVRQLADFVAQRGFIPVAAAAFVGEHSYSTVSAPIAIGRPDTHDLAEAAAFGFRVREKLTSGVVPVDVGKLHTPRTPIIPMLRFIGFVLKYRRQQKKNPIVRLPIGNAAACTHCGRCAAICPTQAIVRGDELHTDPARCIRCCACVKGCPVGARSYDTPFAGALSRNFSRRKPPVTLL